MSGTKSVGSSGRSSRCNSMGHVNLIAYAATDDTYSIKSVLYDTQSYNIMEPRNQKLYTLLHLACYNNNLGLVELYFNYLSYQLDHKMYTKKEIIMWVNAQNDEGFTSLHLAAYRGNLQIINILESNGADYKIRNFNQLSVLHTAAQGDSPVTSYYFILKGIDVNVLDQKGSTPLHWASYSGAYNSVNFLISWGAELNQIDTDTGVTALHLATMQGNARIVRKLLIKGIDRTIKDFTGKTALDFAIENDQKTLIMMIEDKIGLLEFCNVRQPFRPMERRKQSLILFLFMYSTCYVLTILFTFPWVQAFFLDIIKVWWMWTFFAFTGLDIIIFLVAWLKDPGHVKRDKQINMLDMLRRYDCSMICADCQLVKPKRSKHCEVCQACIMVYDHHCPWINNCVGAKNLMIFYFFIICLLAEIILQIFLQIDHFGNHEIQRFEIFSANVMRIGKYFTFVYVIFYCFIFFIPLSILVFIQTGNLLLGQTTFERHQSEKAPKKSSKSSESKSLLNIQNLKSDSTSQRSNTVNLLNKSSQGQVSLINCLEMCCNNKSRKDYESEDGMEFVERSI